MAYMYMLCIMIYGFVCVSLGLTRFGWIREMIRTKFLSIGQLRFCNDSFNLNCINSYSSNFLYIYRNCDSLTNSRTSTGFGDIGYTVDPEVAALTIGLLVGTIVLTYFRAKNAALLANSERRRVLFKQTYYSLLTFMKQRKFPKELAFRVTQYYDLQWKSHEGVLIPTEKSVIWDAPESVIDRVTIAQAQKYIERVPLVRVSDLFT